MSPDEQEAKSRRYVADGLFLMRLSSGNIAVFKSNLGEYLGTVSESKLPALADFFPPSVRPPTKPPVRKRERLV